MPGFKFPDEDGVDSDVTDIEPKKGAKPTVGTDAELEIEIVDDTPAADRGRPALQEEVEDPTDEELGQYSAAVQSRIKKLTHKSHDERRAKEALQRQNAELDRLTRGVIAERDQLRTMLGEGTAVLTTQAKTLSDSEVNAAKAKLIAAHEAFDNAAIVEAQAELNAAQIKRDRLENTKAPSFQPEKRVVDSPSTTQATAPKLDDRTQRWMAANKWFGDGEGGDSAMTGFALGLHQRLVKEHGNDYTRTDEYYSQIDKAVRRTFPDAFKAGTTKSSTIVAPAGRTSASGARRVQLTQTQVALAKKFGLTPQQYAAELIKTEAS